MDAQLKSMFTLTALLQGVFIAHIRFIIHKLKIMLIRLITVILIITIGTFIPYLTGKYITPKTPFKVLMLRDKDRTNGDFWLDGYLTLGIIFVLCIIIPAILIGIFYFIIHG